jgi:hypothetical protein
MLRRVALVRTDVSEEYIASIIRVNTIGQLGTLDSGPESRFLRAIGLLDIVTSSCRHVEK